MEWGVFMAHVKKFTLAQAGALFSHIFRDKETNYSSIAEERSVDNTYYPCTRSKDSYEFIETEYGKEYYHSYKAYKSDEVKFYCTAKPMEYAEKALEWKMNTVEHSNRKDLKCLASWVVTAPEGLPRAEEAPFFRTVYDFVQDRYGTVLGAAVHRDEQSRHGDGRVRPHIHVVFMPICKDKKTGREKICAKEVLTREDLYSFHTQLEKAVEARLGHPVELLNGVTHEIDKDTGKKVSVNKSISKLRAETEQLRADFYREKAGQAFAMLNVVYEKDRELFNTMCKELKNSPEKRENEGQKALSLLDADWNTLELERRRKRHAELEKARREKQKEEHARERQEEAERQKEAMKEKPREEEIAKPKKAKRRYRYRDQGMER